MMSGSLQQACVYFTNPITIETAMGEAASYELRVIELRHLLHVMDQNVQGGYFPEATLSVTENAQQYEQIVGESIESLAQQAEDAVASATDTQSQKAWQHQILILGAIQAELHEPGLKVTSMTIEGKMNSIRELADRSLLVSSVEWAPASQDANGSIEAQPAWVDPNTWLPSQGNIYVHPWGGGSTDRYVTQWMKWTNVSGFASNSAYEHDFFLNNYDGKTYFSRTQNPDGIPIVVSWGSNLPRAYLGTRLSDPSQEVAYVIGCADGDAIQSGTWYWSQIRVAKGNADTDSAKLFGQLGHRFPSWCYTTWCVFADQTEIILGAWVISIPGDRTWTR